MAKALDSLRDEIGTRHVENTSSLEVVQRELKIVIERVDDLAKGFPGGDWEGHRLYHEAVIKKMEARAKLYEDLRADLAKKGLWAVIVAIGAAIWFYVKAKIIQ
ncbi:hypothetical protein BYI23_B004810 [Burkholderia sp. YI23]|nr:hypothetical protein BYI23_B004810 [Burkholderia sp. YI23]